jgi:hypothetical protein
VIATFFNRQTPAAPELLGSKGAAGAEHLVRQANNNHEDMSPAGFNQSFLAQCEMVQGYARPQCGSVRASLYLVPGACHD